VLLDESDVFLEERTISDFARNGVVSTILRAMEYYEGILILTTNRRGSLDTRACAEYPGLTLHHQRVLWTKP